MNNLGGLPFHFPAFTSMEMMKTLNMDKPWKPEVRRVDAIILIGGSIYIVGVGVNSEFLRR